MPGAARQASLRAHNLALVLQALVEGGPESRAALARRLGLTKSTVSALVEQLAAAGVVTDDVAPTPPTPAPGRPASPVALAAGGPVALGIEIAVDGLAGCVVDLAGALRATERVATDNRSGPPRERLAQAGALAARLAARATAEGGAPVGAGIAFPGIVDAAGVARRAPNLPGWAPCDLPALLARLSGLGTLVWRAGNEANLAALGEQRAGAGRGQADFVLVSGEVGIGAGLVLGGRLVTGPTGAAGELGHVCVAPDGPLCGCGARGCVEQYAGLEALQRAGGVSGRAALLSAAGRRDAAVLAALERAGRALGVACAALVNVVDVPVIVLGGLYRELASVLSAPLCEELGRRALRGQYAPVRVVASELGEDAAMRGAAGLVLDEVVRDPVAFLPELGR